MAGESGRNDDKPRGASAPAGLGEFVFHCLDARRFEDAVSARATDECGDILEQEAKLAALPEHAHPRSHQRLSAVFATFAGPIWMRLHTL